MLLIKAFKLKAVTIFSSIRAAVTAIRELSNDEPEYSEGPALAAMFESCVVRKVCGVVSGLFRS